MVGIAAVAAVGGVGIDRLWIGKLAAWAVVERGVDSCCHYCCFDCYCLGAPGPFEQKQALRIYHAWLASALLGNRYDSSCCSR